MTTVKKTVEHLIRMGEYESLRLSATVEMEVPGGVSKDHALDEIDELLNSALEDDLKQARKICDPNSYIIEWRTK